MNQSLGVFLTPATEAHSDSSAADKVQVWQAEDTVAQRLRPSPKQRVKSAAMPEFPEVPAKDEYPSLLTQLAPGAVVAYGFERELRRLRVENVRLQKARTSAEEQATAALAKQIRAEQDAARARRGALSDREELEQTRDQYAWQLGKVADLETAYGKEIEQRRFIEDMEGNHLQREPPSDGEVIRSSMSVRPSRSMDELQLAACLAAFEVDAMRVLKGEELSKTRRRVLAKWHPDKNSHSVHFSTLILQELQRQPGWQ